ncbi:MAG TPA: F0F1 ATP synthase subunit gamma, partial [Candidatus Fusicatenibacter merdavium]|nr:F0F1 ATP synthase subunit gamma [Candidatus Fusicatenibacter merdavium]
MANMKEIQDRIRSVQDTMKITNAMYTISSSKLKRAKKALEDTEPYFYALQSAISRTLRHVPDLEHRYFDERENIQGKDRKVGYVVVTGDKGMAGAYNHNVEKIAEDQMAARDCDNYLFVLGEMGRQYFTRRNQ